MTIGAFPVWSVAAARLDAAELRREVDRGLDPIEARSAERDAPTVADLAAKFEREHLLRLRPRTAKGYACFIKEEILPAIGGMKVASVSYDDIARLHQRIPARAAIHANRCVARFLALPFVCHLCTALSAATYAKAAIARAY